MEYAVSVSCARKRLFAALVTELNPVPTITIYFVTHAAPSRPLWPHRIILTVGNAYLWQRRHCPISLFGAFAKLEIEFKRLKNFKE